MSDNSLQPHRVISNALAHLMGERFDTAVHGVFPAEDDRKSRKEKWKFRYAKFRTAHS